MWKKRNAHFASWQFCREWLSWSMTEKIINFELMGSQNISIFICRWNSVPGKMGGGTKGRLMCNAGWNVGQFQWWPEVRGYSIEFLLWLRPCSRRLCCQLQIYEVSCRQTHALATTHALTTSVWRGCWSSATLSAFAKLSYQWVSGARVVCRRHPSTAYEDDYND